MALEKVKTECGSCAPASQTSRWGYREHIKHAARKRRRKLDKVEVERSLKES